MNTKVWESVPLENLVEVRDSMREPISARVRALREGPYPYYGANGVAGNIDDYLFEGPHILIAEDGGHFDDPYKNVAYSVDGKFWVNNHAHIIRVLSGVDHDFLVNALNTVDWMKYVSGSTRLKLTQRKMREVILPLPPLPEQKRIVAKIEELRARTQKAREALAAVPPLLEKLKQAVLAAAFRGDLTRAWREQNPDTEPASALLARIRVERRRAWEAAELAKMQAKGKVPKNDQWKEKYQPLKALITRNLSNLPASWSWTSIEEMGTVSLGRQRSPKHHNGDYMRPYLRVMNVFEDEIRLDDVMEMNFPPKDFERFSLNAGDVLLNEGQSLELVGRPAVYRGEMEGVCFTNTLVRFRPGVGTSSDFAFCVFLNHMKTGRFMSIANRSVNIAHLGADRFAKLEFPVPPLEEQVIISKIVRTTLDYCKEGLKKNAQLLSMVDQLDQTILDKAFKGELVPQDPNDEPAADLLARIAAEKAAQAAAQPKRRRKAKV